MRVYVVKKLLLWGRSHFVCCNITCVSLWLLCNVHFVQSMQRTRLKDFPKVNVFCAICSPKVYGPFFFAEGSITGTTYLDIVVYCPSYTTMWCKVKLYTINVATCFTPLGSSSGLQNFNHTGWSKIPFVLSVEYCEGMGGRRRVGLRSKGAGSWEVPITTLRSYKDGVVQRAVCICRRNLVFAKSLYHSSAACVPYSLPNPPLGLSTGPKIHSGVGWELQGNGKYVWKKMRTTTHLSNTREHQGCQTVRFAVSQALCMETPCKQRPPLARYSF